MPAEHRLLVQFINEFVAVAACRLNPVYVLVVLVFIELKRISRAKLAINCEVAKNPVTSTAVAVNSSARIFSKTQLRVRPPVLMRARALPVIDGAPSLPIKILDILVFCVVPDDRLLTKSPVAESAQLMNLQSSMIQFSVVPAPSKLIPRFWQLKNVKSEMVILATFDVVSTNMLD